MAPYKYNESINARGLRGTQLELVALSARFDVRPAYSYVLEENIDDSKRNILVFFPHGAFPIAQILGGTLMHTMFPQAPVYSIAASAVFYIPVWRHIVAWIGSVPATREEFKRLLKQGSVAVVVGGIAEMFMIDKLREGVKLKGRKGFARMALEEEVDGIVPVYYFGQTHGKPIPVPKGIRRSDPNFEEEVDKLVAATAKELQVMYDSHKEEYGWKDRPLHIE
eukprot:gene31525-6708_t